MSVRDKVILVTGSTRGIGEVVARDLAKNGAWVWIHGRQQADCDRLREAMAADGLTVNAVVFDLRSPDGAARAIDTVLETAGRLDVLVNNAAMVADSPVVMMADDDFVGVVETNLTGTYRVCRAAIGPMMRQRAGAIVNLGSVAGSRGTPMQANYSAAKAGLVGLTRTLAREMGPRGIRVNIVVPGLIDAGMTLRTNQRMLRGVLDLVPLKRRGTAQEVANAVRFLASDEASYIVGAELVVDGGLLA